MVSIEPCEKHEIINCSICHKPPPPLRIKTGGGGGKFSSGPVSGGNVTITAKYPGRCYECRETFEVGDPIKRSFDDEGWICSDCAECCLPLAIP
jgi:hypothetical protein